MTEATRAERAAAVRQSYELGAQRTSDMDLAFNGLLNQHTFATARNAPPATEVDAARDRINVLLDQAKGREFTADEQSVWQSVLGTTAAHYAAEEERAR